MKRKKWSEAEERSLLSKYFELVQSGALSKLKTREKKFKPIAEYVNRMHHFRDPVSFPFRWSWRDVSIKVQNMRHQYLGVKIKIRVSAGQFNWSDGEHHWENFLRYRDVFGDHEIDDDFDDAVSINNNNDKKKKKKKKKKAKKEVDETDDDVDDDPDIEDLFDSGLEGLGFDLDDENEDEEARISNGELRKLNKLRLLGGRVLELREAMLKREDKRRERDFNADKVLIEMGERALRMDDLRERLWEKESKAREARLQELEMDCQQLRRVGVEKEVERERQWRVEMEQEEMQWRETMLSLQIQHEKSVMQVYSEACQNQMQMLGVMGRMLSQFFGSSNDDFGGTMTPQVLENMQHSCDLLDNVKPGSDSEFMFKGPKDHL